MSIMKTLYTGVAGISAHGEALGVVGDNIANVNTVGYKAERAVFSDLLGRSIMAVGQAGSGVTMSKISRIFQQGTLLTSDSPTDLAINGSGFFCVRGEVAGIDSNFYTRAGQFNLDNQGQLVNPGGMILQGYIADPITGTIDNQLTDLQVANNVLPPQVTSTVDISLNLDSTATIPPAFDPANPGTTSNYSTAITVYDSLGNSHRVDVYFAKTADNEWDWHALVDGGELTGGTAGTAVECAAGHMTYTTGGLLDTETVTVASDFDFLGAEQNQVIDFDFGDSITTDGGTGTTGSSQFAAGSAIRSQEQNGYATGTLAAVGVQGNGDVMAIYTNGEQQLVGKVALATFEAETELARAGASLWMETGLSGEARIGEASTGSAGSITSGVLEQSTVDLAEEFVNLIAYQRGFQANSRTISTADDLYAEVVNLKR